ncbi:UNVERIFIED_CONTAM: hypothetical protein GTU68_038559, partial [Idotea baltica]|nr:hypothetical protein [Idotea baltica]
MLLAIESSCDETALSLVDSNDFHLIDELLASQVEFHKAYGGVVPELAAREHIKNLPLLLDELLRRNSVTAKELTAVAVTNGPGLKGCLLVGVSFAKGLCQALGIPLLPVHHIEGHLFAANASSLQFPYLSLVVSGGHSILVTVDGLSKYTLLTRTRDDAAGEAFDKIATLLGLPYPGGPALSNLAEKGDRKRFKLPVALSN